MGQCVSRGQAGPYAFIRQYDADSLASSLYNGGCRHTWGGQSDSKGTKKKSNKSTKGVSTSFGFRRRPASSSRADDNARKHPLDTNGNGGSTEELSAGADALSGRSTPLARPRKEAAGMPLRTNRFGFRQPTSSKTAKVSDVNVAAEPAFNVIHKDKDSTYNNNALDKTSTNGTFNGGPLLTTQVSSSGQTTIIGATGLPKSMTKQTVILTYQPQQYTAQEVGRPRQVGVGSRVPDSHANPRSSSASRAYTTSYDQGGKCAGKYTFQTNQLPKPQYPAVKLLDTKSAKQVANNTRKVSGSSDVSREGSATDSGVSTTGEGSASGGESPRLRRRPRNLEMVMKGAHSFHLRELQVQDLDLMDDALITDSAVIPLPKLPSTFDDEKTPDIDTPPEPLYVPSVVSRPVIPIVVETSPPQGSSPMSTLERYRARNRERPNRIQTFVTDFKDEEKFVLDRAQPEMLNKQNSFVKSQSSADSPNTVSSSKETSPSCKSEESQFEHSGAWNNHAAGEAMATRSQDDVSLAFSISSCEDEKSKKESTELPKIKEIPQRIITIVDEPEVPHPLLMKSLTLSQHDALRSMMMGSMSSSNYSATSTCTNISSDVNNLTLTLDETKFDMSALETSTQSLIDDETSPADSLISSTSTTDSNNDLANIDRDLPSISSAYQTANTTAKTKSSDPIEVEDVEDEVNEEAQSPRKEDPGSSKEVSPPTPGTPTHASGSLSLSDGRDYFDDEIADQPALVFRKSNEDSPSNRAVTESESHRQLKSRERITSSPLVQRSRKLNGRGGAERTPSLDTLSSLASDDLMMNDDLAQSITSLQSVDDYIERLDHSMRSGLNSLDERQLRQELSSSKFCAVKQWNQLLEQNNLLDRQLAAMAHGKGTDSISTSNASLASIGASLPVRTARLLQRSRAHTPDTGASDGSASPAPASLLQDVVDIKTLLLQLKRVLQEPGEEHHSMSSETLDPLLAACGDPARGNGRRLPPPASPLHPEHCADLRRQILYLQSQVEERDRLVKVLQQQMSKLTENNVTSADPRCNSSEETCNVATQTDRLRPPMSTTLPNGENSGLVSWNEPAIRKLSLSDAQTKTKKSVGNGVMPLKCQCGARRVNGHVNGVEYDNAYAESKKSEPLHVKTSRVGSRYLQALANKDTQESKPFVKRDLSVNERSIRKTSLYSSRSRSIENFQNQNLRTSVEPANPLNRNTILEDATQIRHHTSYGDLYHGRISIKENSNINGHQLASQNGQSTDTDYSSDGGYKSLPSSINCNGSPSPKKVSGIPRRSVENRFVTSRHNVKASAV